MKASELRDALSLFIELYGDADIDVEIIEEGNGELRFCDYPVQVGYYDDGTKSCDIRLTSEEWLI